MGSEVDFFDEPSFSTMSMFLKGREWLDEKGKLLVLPKEYLPETWVLRGGEGGDDATAATNDNDAGYHVCRCQHRC